MRPLWTQQTSALAHEARNGTQSQRQPAIVGIEVRMTGPQQDLARDGARDLAAIVNDDDLKGCARVLAG